MQLRPRSPPPCIRARTCTRASPAAHPSLPHSHSPPLTPATQQQLNSGSAAPLCVPLASHVEPCRPRCGGHRRGLVRDGLGRRPGRRRAPRATRVDDERPPAGLRHARRVPPAQGVDAAAGGQLPLRCAPRLGALRSHHRRFLTQRCLHAFSCRCRAAHRTFSPLPRLPLALDHPDLSNPQPPQAGIYATALTRRPIDIRGTSFPVEFEIVDKAPTAGELLGTPPTHGAPVAEVKRLGSPYAVKVLLQVRGRADGGVGVSESAPAHAGALAELSPSWLRTLHCARAASWTGHTTRARPCSHSSMTSPTPWHHLATSQPLHSQPLTPTLEPLRASARTP